MERRNPSKTTRWTAYGCAFVLAFQPLFSVADIVVDNTATFLDTAANGVDIVNIANPNANGISHNRFVQFDVDQSGVILNNSAGFTQTQLGGYITGNENLSGNSARLILNEVTGTNRSELRGYTEIAGQAADYVLANPYGITCDGCGFLNIPRVTLAAGSPILESGRLRSFNVDRGQFIVKGMGLDARTANHLDIIARSAYINAQLHAQNVNMALGHNQVDYVTNQIRAKDADATGEPKFALDVAALGGMYVNAITLKGNERGVGVRVAGDMAAATGDIVLTADGSIEVHKASAVQRMVITSESGNVALKDNVHANTVNVVAAQHIEATGDYLMGAQEINLRAKNITSSAKVVTGFDKNGQYQPGASLQMVADHQLTNHAEMISSGEVSINANTLVNSPNAMIQADGNLTLNAGDAINQQAVIAAAGNMDIQVSGTFNNTLGTVFSDKKNVQVSAWSLNNTSGIFSSGGDIDIEIGQLLDNTNGNITAGRNVQIDGDGALINAGGSIGGGAGSQLTFSGDFNNQGGSYVREEFDVVLNFINLDNRNGLIHHTGTGLFQLNISGEFDNRKGQLASDGSLWLDALQILNNEGLIFAPDGLTLVSGNWIDNTGGRIITDGLLNIQAQQINSTAGMLYSGNSMQLDVAGTLQNSGGTIRTNRALSIQADTLINRQGLVFAFGSEQGSLGITGLLDNTGGTLSSNAGNFILNSSELDNTDGLITHFGGDQLQVTLSGKFANQQGAIKSNAEIMDISAQNIVNQDGTIVHAGADRLELTVDHALENVSGTIISSGDLEIGAESVNNQSGYLSANTIAMTGVTLVNTAGIIDADRLWMNLTGDLINGLHGSVTAWDADQTSLILRVDGAIENAGTLQTRGVSAEIEAGSLNNTGNLLHTGNESLQMILRGDLINEGRIESNAAILIQSNNLVNQRGLLMAGTDINLTLENILNNIRGVLDAAGSISLAAYGLDNTEGEIISAGSSDTEWSVSGPIVNAFGTIKSNAATMQISTQSLHNSNGLLIHAGLGALDIQASDSLDNEGGKVYGVSSTINLHANEFNNLRGEILGNQINVSGGEFDNTDGVVEADSVAITLTGDLYNHVDTDAQSGVISALGSQVNSLAIDVAGVLTNSGTLQTAAQSATISAAAMDNTNGLIAHTGIGVLNLNIIGDLINATGDIASLGSIDMQAAAISNREQGNIIANHALIARAQTVANLNGVFSAGNTIDIQVTNGDLTNSEGARILSGQAGGGISVSGNVINNEGASIYSAGGIFLLAATGRIENASMVRLGGGGELTLTANRIDNTNGRIDAVGSINITGFEQLINNSNLQKNNGITADHIEISGETVDNTRGNIQAYGANSLLIDATSLTNNQGTLFSQGDATLIVNALNNVNGSIQAENTLTLTIPSFNLSDGLLNAAESLVINTQGDLVNNQNNQLLSEGDLIINTTGNVINWGTISTFGNLGLGGLALTNYQGAEISGGSSLDLNFSGIVTNYGRLSGSENLTLNASGLTNNGILSAGNDLVTDVSGNLENRSLIFAGNDINLYVAGNVSNLQHANIFALNNIHIAGNRANGRSLSVLNESGTIEAYDGNLGIYTQQLTNRRANFSVGVNGNIMANTGMASIIAGGDMTINAGDIHNNISLIAANGNMNLSGGSLLNEGRRYGHDNPHDYYVAMGARNVQCYNNGYCFSTRLWVEDPDDYAEGTLYAIIDVNSLNQSDWLKENYLDVLVHNGNGFVYYYTGVIVNNYSDPTYHHLLNTFIWSTSNIDFTQIPHDWSDHPYLYPDIYRSTGYWGEPNGDWRPPSIYHVGFFVPDRVWRDSLTTVSSTIQSGGVLTGTFTGTVENATVEYAPNGQVSENRNIFDFVGHSHVSNAANNNLQSANTGALGQNLQSVELAETPEIDTSIVNNAAMQAVGNALDGNVNSQAGGTDIEQIPDAPVRETGPIASVPADDITTPDINPIPVNPGGSGNAVSVISYNPANQMNLPVNSGLFVVSTDPQSRYLVETNPLLTDLRSFMGTDYLLSRLGIRPEDTQRRLGDAFYETRLLREGIFEIFGNRYLTHQDTGQRFVSDAEQFQYLMDNAVAASDALELRLGIGLSGEQVARLTHDILWLVEQEVEGQRVLVPVYYASAARAGDLDNRGALLAGQVVNLSAQQGITNTGSVNAEQGISLRTEGDLQNAGSIRAEDFITLDAGSIVNRRDTIGNTGSIVSGRQGELTLIARTGDIENQAHIGGGDLRLHAESGSIINEGRMASVSGLLAIAQQDITNAANAARIGSIEAGGNLTLVTREGDIRNQAQITTEMYGHGYRTTVGEAPTLQAGGTMTLNSGRDLLFTAANVTAGQDLYFMAKRDIQAENAANESYSENLYGYIHRIEHVGSSFTAGGDVTMSAGRDLTLAGTDVNAGGRAVLSAMRDMTLEAVVDKYTSEYARKRQESNTSTVAHVQSQINASGDVSIRAGQDLNLIGISVGAGGNVSLHAERDMLIEAVTDSSYNYSYTEKNRSLGRKRVNESEHYHETTVGGAIAASSNVFINSMTNDGGDVAMLQSNNVLLKGAQIIAAGDAFIMAGNNVEMESVTEAHLDYTQSRRKGTFGLTGRGSTVLNLESVQIGTEIIAGNDAVVAAGRDVNATASYIAAGNNVELYAGRIHEDGDINLDARHHEVLSANESYRKSFGIKVSSDAISFGQKREQTDSASQAINAGTVVLAGNDLIARSRDINITGGTLSAGNNIDMEADRFGNIHANQGAISAEHGQTSRRDAISWGSDSNSVSAFAGHERHEQLEKQSHQAVAVNQISAGGNIRIHAGEDLNVSGTDFASGRTTSLTADNNIDFLERHDHYGTYTEDTLTRTGLTLTANHNMGDARDALEQVGKGGNAVSNISGTLRAADAINNIGPSASAHLGQTQTTVAHTAETSIARGVTFKAGEDLYIVAGNDVTMSGAQGHAERNLVIHGDNVFMQAADNTHRGTTTTDYLQTGVTLQASPGNASLTAGFSQADSNLDTTQVTTTGSQFSAGKDLSITADNDVFMIGSHAKAGRSLLVEAGNDVFFSAAQEYATSEYSANHVSAGAGFNLGSEGIGYTGYVAGGEEDLQRSNQYHINTTLTAGDTLTVRSGNDTTLSGARLLAKNVDMNVGNNLYGGSLQDAGDASGRRWDASVSATLGPAPSFGVNAGYGETDGSSAWVNNQTSIVGTEGVSIRVGNHTHLEGALIANIREDGTDGGNLRLSTHTLSYGDLHDHDRESSYYLSGGFSTGGSIGANQQTGARQDDSGASFSIDGGYQNHHREQITRATLGQGEITVRSDAGTGHDSLAGLNRDIDLAQEITRDDGRAVDIYGSNTAVDSLTGLTKLDGDNTVFRWADQAQSLGDLGTWKEVADNAQAITDPAAISEAWQALVGEIKGSLGIPGPDIPAEIAQEMLKLPEVNLNLFGYSPQPEPTQEDLVLLEGINALRQQMTEQEGRDTGVILWDNVLKIAWDLENGGPLVAIKMLNDKIYAQEMNELENIHVLRQQVNQLNGLALDFDRTVGTAEYIATMGSGVVRVGISLGDALLSSPASRRSQALIDEARHWSGVGEDVGRQTGTANNPGARAGATDGEMIGQPPGSATTTTDGARLADEASSPVRAAREIDVRAATDGEMVGQPYRFDPKSFENGRTLSAEDVNMAHTTGLRTEFPPYRNGTTVNESYLEPGTKIYAVEFRSQDAPGGWATPKHYSSLEEARSELALLPEFKNGDLVLREYTVVNPAPVRQGSVGELTSANGITYEGGGIQMEFLFDRGSGWEEYLNRTGVFNLGQ